MSRVPWPPVDVARLRLSYIIGSYPVLTETFIDREIGQVIGRGVDLEIVSIRRPQGVLSPSQLAMADRVRYLLPASLPGLFLAHLISVVRRPRTYFGLLLWLLTRPHPSGRFRSVLHFATGIYAAWALRDRRGVHIHAHFIDRAATVALVAARFLDTTYSVTAHAREIYVRPVLIRERMAGAAFVVTCTEYNRRHLAAQVAAPGGGPRMVRIYHGLELTQFAPSERRGAEARDSLLLAVAQLMERKGLRYLIQACRLLVDRGIPVRCAIVGDGPMRADLDHLIQDLDLGGVVQLIGPLSYPDVREYYRRAHAMVLPCIVTSDGDRDGIPNAILEAMAEGLPVVSTAVSGLPEVVRDGETGLVVPQRDATAIADAVQRILMNPDLALRLAEEARALVVREFDLRRNIDRLLELFGSVRPVR